MHFESQNLQVCHFIYILFIMPKKINKVNKNGKFVLARRQANLVVRQG